jgi:hypothetical protein
MYAEEFFKEVVKSYEQLKTKSGRTVPDIRSYCQCRHVSWRAFKRWASTDEAASVLLSEECPRQRSLKTKRSPEANQSRKKRQVSSECCKAEASGGPLLHPLQIKTSPYDNDVEQAKELLLLRGIRIIFPSGVRVTVREATGKAISSLIRGEKTENRLLCLH